MKRIFTLAFLILSVSAMAQSQITWTMAANVATSASGNEHPHIALDGSGNPLILWGHVSRCMFSKWNGSAFTTPILLNGSVNIAEASWMGPDMAAKGDTVYAVMKETPEADTSSHIYIVRSFDGGITFSAPVRVEFIGANISRFPTVTIDATGNPIVGFMKFDPDFTRARWVVTRSSDYGNTFSTDVLASGWSTGNACDCCPGTIVNSGNNVAMLYRDNNVNIRDTWAGLSTDGGLSFSNGWNVDGNNWNLSACPSSGPDAIIIGDSLFSVFMNGASGTSRTYRSVSSLSSGIAQPAQLLTGTIANLNSQNYPRVAQYGNAVAIVWQQSVNMAEQLPILFTNDIGNGFPAAYDTVDLSNITNADVAVGNGNVFVIWEDDNSGTLMFRKGTFTPSTTSINEFNEISFSVYPNPVNNVLTLQSAAEIESFKIMNVLGEVKKENALSKNKNEKIDISQLASGIYFLEVQSGARVLNKKFIKSDN